MKKIIFLALVLFGTKAFSQTKVIEHKSHSGNMKNFSATAGNSNFGLSPAMEMGTVVDSIINISDSVVVQISHTYYLKHVMDTLLVNSIHPDAYVFADLKKMYKKGKHLFNIDDEVVFVEKQGEENSIQPKEEQFVPIISPNQKFPFNLLLSVVVFCLLFFILSVHKAFKKPQIA